MIEEGITQAASLNIALTVSNLYEWGHAYFSPLRLDDDITDYVSNIVEGKVKATTKPGLGVDIREDVLEKYVTGRTLVTKSA